jgi:hypothetical protein
MLLAQVKQRQNGIADGVGYAAPGGVLDGLGQPADLGDEVLAVGVGGGASGGALGGAPRGARGGGTRRAAAGPGYCGGGIRLPRCQLLEQLAHDVHADAAGAAAPA